MATTSDATAAPAAEQFRHVLGHVPTSVAIISGLAADVPAGLAVGTLCSVSLEPPLVLFCPSKDSTSWPAIAASGAFCANVLSEAQGEICRRFARPGADKFAGIDWRPAPVTGSPILEEVLVWIDCTIESIHDSGDHHVVIGRVRALQSGPAKLPLVSFRRGYLHEDAGAAGLIASPH